MVKNNKIYGALPLPYIAEIHLNYAQYVDWANDILLEILQQ